MKKLLSILVLLGTIVFAGCQSSEVDHWNDGGRIVRIAEISDNFDLFCDKSTNIVYLRYWGPSHRAGFTAYLNAEGNPARCNEVHR